MKKSSLWIKCFIVLGFSVFALNAAYAAGPVTATYQAENNHLPDQVCPTWKVSSNGSGSSALGNDVLTITAENCSDTFNYSHYLPDLNITYPVEIEFSLRVLSGSYCHTARDAAAVSVTVAPHRVTQLYLGKTRMFLLSGGLTVGNSVALDPNDTAFHTYKMVIQDTGAIDVFRDNEQTPIITGAVYDESGAWADQVSISWGNITNYASGVVDWKFVKHNACVPIRLP